MKTFFYYNKNSTLLDASKLKRVNSGALEDCRRAMVWSMKLGTTLCIYCGDVLPDFLEKICISKYKDTFPLSLFMYGGMENDMVREKIFRDDEKEGGQCPIRPGFMVCIMIMYDTMGLQMSSMRKEELVGQWQSLHEILVMRYERCKAMGRFLYEANGAIGTTRSMATALCLSKRFLQARAEAAFLIFMMVQPEAPGAFHVSTEMLRNGTGLSLVRLARFEDLKLDWMVLGVAKCGTTSLQFNLGIHPEATLKSTHSNTFSHTLLYSSSRFLPVHELQREFVSEMPSGLLGHPDWYKGNRSIGDIRGRQRSRLLLSG
eukprot:Skav202300  [mRNA]  locus=scaffold60:57964:60804:+ [translate_table: standard]